MLSILVGIIFVAAGVWGIIHWPSDVASVMKGILPLMVICGGVIAVVAGFSRLRDDSKNGETDMKNGDQARNTQEKI
jgi:hypothetical protein